MDQRNSPPRELSTWPEIAGYLGVSSRTAQTWAKERGLPVRKLAGRVFAHASELDGWVAVNPPAGPAEPRPRRFLLGMWAAVALVFVAVLPVLVVWRWLRPVPQPPGQMVRFETRGNWLEVFDQRGARLWSYSLGFVLDNEAGGSRSGQFADVDGDGVAELLFLPSSGKVGKGLYCFRADGRLAWSSPIGRTLVAHGDKVVSADYVAHKILLLKKPRRDGGSIVVLSHHVSTWPSRLAIYTPDGKLAAEHWHPGPLFDLTIADLDGDGDEELVTGGVNECFRKKGSGAILLVFDSNFASGQGPVVAGDSSLVEGADVTEPAAVLVFPDFPGKPAGLDDVPRIRSVRWIGGFMEVFQHAPGRSFNLHYQLNPRLEVVNVAASSQLEDLIAPNVPPRRRLEMVWAAATRIETLRNRFASTKVEGPR